MSKYVSTKKHAPIDETVQVPAAIRAAAARSEALHKQMYEQEPTQQEPTQQEGEQQPQEPVQQPNEAAEDKNGERKEPPAQQPQQASEQTQQAPAQEKGPQAANAATGSETDWEHRYHSMKGRYDRQVEATNNMSRRISDLEALIANMQKAAVQQPQQPPSELSFKPIGQEERETFGEDFIDVAQRAAMEKMSPEVQRLQRELQRINQQLEQVTNVATQQTKMTVHQTLDNRVPNWRELNRSPEFIAWANLPDPFSGVTRITMLREAFANGDATRVVNFFQGFLKDEATTSPAQGAQPVNQSQQRQKVPLESFAAPGRARAPAASEQQTAPGEKETITHAQITEFYRLVNQGYYRGNEAEKQDLERRIFEAQRDGRIV